MDKLSIEGIINKGAIEQTIENLIIKSSQKVLEFSSILNPIITSKMDQITLDLLKNNSFISESVTQNLFRESEFLKMQQENSTVMNQLISSITKQQNEIFRIDKIQSELFKNDSSIFDSVTQQLLKNKNFIENLNNFSKEFYSNDNLDFDIKYEDIEEINKKIEEKKDFTKKDLVTYVLFLMALVGFINDSISLYSTLNPDNSEYIKTRQMMDIGIDKIFQSSIETQQMIKELDNKFPKSLNQEIYYEVTKNTDVREQPNIKSKKIAVVYPKQKLLVIENKPYWLQVEYFDEKRNETIIGWVSKKCTKRLN